MTNNHVPSTPDCRRGRLEAQLAEATAPRAQLRDPLKVYNPMTTPELAGKAPGLAWEAYLKALTAATHAPAVSSG